MYIGKIREGRILLVIAIKFSMISAIATCNGRTMLRAGTLSEYEKQIILDMHNRMRQSVALGQIASQPPAANMVEMKWDNELASNAQKWAESCRPYIHDEKRHSSRFPVGQNIAKVWTTKSPMNVYDVEPDFAKDAIYKWFNEFRAFRYQQVGHGTTGHYTQMVWAETNLIGCGYALYHDPSQGFTKNYVCNYGPSGNVHGEVPYQKGYPNCYNYGLSSSRKYHGLCDKTNNYYYDVSSNYISHRHLSAHQLLYVY